MRPMPEFDRADPVCTMGEVPRGLLGLAQVFHELVAERLQKAGKVGGREPGEIRLAHGARTVEAQLESKRLAFRHESHGGEIVKDNLASLWRHALDSRE